MVLCIILWGDIMIGENDTQVIEIINQILLRGNDAIIRRKKDGIVILEESKKIKYDTCSIGSKAGQ